MDEVRRGIRRRLMALGLLLALACGLFPASALAATADSSAAGTSTACSPCVPTEEQLAAYEADGTLAERQAYQESLGHDQASSELVEQALARQNAADGISLLSAGAATKGMATTGKAHVLAIRVSFPDMQFDESDTEEALQAIIGPSSEDGVDTGNAANYPYESLSAYYRRSSYGKLSITGEVFSYTAQHERSYYTDNAFALFDEAITALDAELDLSRFDANGDTYLDGVYLRFAGDNEGWGSAWWSNCANYSSVTSSYEGGSLHIACGVKLSNLNARTIIHETGHVLGLPDYYSYDRTAVSRTGILVSDMMYDNQGDHCGFSKWLLGWLDSDDVTRVVVTEDGITAKRGDTTIATAAAGESLDRALGVFTSSDEAQTGGIIVLSTEDGGIFSSYYVLQYDHYAGNQSVFYNDPVGVHELPQGFRMYRVQAALNDAGTEFAKTNSSGTMHDQLIELVDMDETSNHYGGDNLIISAPGSEGYGCMLYAGSSVTPETYPSTNFNESVSFGFTGISVEALSCGDTEGAVRISYSGEAKPSPEKSITLTYAGGGISASGSLVLEASSELRVADYTKTPQLIIDGTAHTSLGVVASGTSVTVTYQLDAESITAGSACELVFPAGYFAIGYADGATITSPELRVSLGVDERLAALSASGLYDGTLYLGMEGSFMASGLYTLPDGSQGYAMLADSAIRLCTINTADDSVLNWVKADASGLPASDGCASFEAAVLDDGRVLVVVVNTSNTMTCYWIDASTGKVEATHAISGVTDARVVTSGSDAVLAIEMATDLRGTPLVSLSADEAGVVSEHWGWTGRTPVCAADSGTLALATTEYTELGVTVTKVELVDAAALVPVLASSSYTAETVVGSGDVCKGLARQTIVPEEGRKLLGAATNGSSVALLMGGASSAAGTTRQLVAVYDASGTQTARAELDGSYGRVQMAAHGAVAVSQVSVAPYGVGSCTTLLFDAGLESSQVLGTLANSAGGWLADGRWYNVNEGVNAGVFDGGEYKGKLVHYNITAQIDKVPDDPVTPATPDVPVVPSGSDDANASQASAMGSRAKMPATGDDSTPLLALGLGAAIALCFGLALHKRERLRRNP